MEADARPRHSSISFVRSRNLAAILGKETSSELKVLSLLPRLGYRFRLLRRNLPVSDCVDLKIPWVYSL